MDFFYLGEGGTNNHLNESINTKSPIFFWYRCPNAKIYHIWKNGSFTSNFNLLICLFEHMFLFMFNDFMVNFFYIGKIIDYNILNFLFNFIFECLFMYMY